MASASASLILQSRDLELLRGLFESRIMTARHISGLYFDGKAEMAKKRLQKLKAFGLIGEQERHVNEPATLYLSRKGYDLLLDHGCLSEYAAVTAISFRKRTRVSPLTRNHELAVMDVKTAFATALRNSTDYTLSQFSTWPALHRFTATVPGSRDREINPDGFIRISRNDGSGEFYFFLEVDKSTETQGILATKAACYLEFYRSGGFAKRMGSSTSEIERFPFRLLMVFDNEHRRNNTAEALLRLRTPIYRQAWLTTVGEILRAPLGEVWTNPANYLPLKTPHEFASGPRNKGSSLKNESAEMKVMKHFLLE